MMSKKKLFIIFSLVFTVIFFSALFFLSSNSKKKVNQIEPVNKQLSPLPIKKNNIDNTEIIELKIDNEEEKKVMPDVPEIFSSSTKSEKINEEDKFWFDSINQVGLDNDGDDLDNYQEDKNGTDKNKADSDNDGINDYDEIVKYQTNPNSTDSDNDGYSDKTEIDGGFNPNGPGRF